MSHAPRTYRGFEITSTVLQPQAEDEEVPRLPARAVAERGRIHIEEIQPLTGEWDALLRGEIDRLLDPAHLRGVSHLN